jgi:hypothetical protein
MQSRKPQSLHHEIVPLGMSVRCVRTKARRARVPAEVMQCVAAVFGILTLL